MKYDKNKTPVSQNQVQIKSFTILTNPKLSKNKNFTFLYSSRQIERRNFNKLEDIN